MILPRLPSYLKGSGLDFYVVAFNYDDSEHECDSIIVDDDFGDNYDDGDDEDDDDDDEDDDAGCVRVG